MSEWTPWVACNRLVDSGTSGAPWISLDNAEVDDANFAYAQADASGAWNNNVTEITQSFTDNLALIIPTNATIEAIETRFHFEMPNQLFFIPQVNVYRSNSGGDLIENIGFISGAIQTKELTWTDTSGTQADNIINGTVGSMYMKCQHAGNESPDYEWQLNLRYVDIRVQFTRAPNVPRTAYIGLF